MSLSFKVYCMIVFCRVIAVSKTGQTLLQAFVACLAFVTVALFYRLFHLKFYPQICQLCSYIFLSRLPTNFFPLVR